MPRSRNLPPFSRYFSKADELAQSRDRMRIDFGRTDLSARFSRGASGEKAYREGLPGWGTLGIPRDCRERISGVFPNDFRAFRGFLPFTCSFCRTRPNQERKLLTRKPLQKSRLVNSCVGFRGFPVFATYSIANGKNPLGIVWVLSMVSLKAVWYGSASGQQDHL